jgi:membrane protein
MRARDEKSAGREPPLRLSTLHELLTVDLSTLSGLRSFAIRLVRVAQLVWRGFSEDNLPLHAAALTFTSLVSLVPMLAIAFALLKGLGAGEEAAARLEELTAVMPEQFSAFITQALAIVNRTNFWALGWVGVVVLFVTVVQVLGNIEASFNIVWGVTTPRTIWRRFTNYVSITVVVPVLIMTGFAIAATLSSETFIARLGQAAWAYRLLIRFAPLAVLWFAFSFLFLFLPNTQVRAGSAALGGLVTALLWAGWQKIYIALQIGVAQYNAIYGTFASVPIFLVWLSISWVITLLGAEITFALQNHATYHMEQIAGRASVRSRVRLAVAAVLEAARAFAGQRPLFNIPDYSRDHGVSVRLLNEVVRLLVRDGILAETADRPGAFALLRPPDAIRVGDIARLVIEDGADAKPSPGRPDQAPLDRAMEAFDRGIAQSLEPLSFGELMARAGADGADAAAARRDPS